MLVQVLPAAARKARSDRSGCPVAPAFRRKSAGSAYYCLRSNDERGEGCRAAGVANGALSAPSSRSHRPKVQEMVLDRHAPPRPGKCVTAEDFC